MGTNAFGGDVYGGEPYAGKVVTGANPFHNSFPGLIVEIGFGNNALDEPVTWTDVSIYARSVQTKRGRQHELGRFEAGTATLVLSNRDGRFSSFNTSGAYYPNVKPFVPVRVRASWNGTVYPVFRGYIESWPLVWADAANSDVTVNAVDATKVLNLKRPTNLSTYSTTILADTPTRFWELGDTPGATVALDSSGNGATATVVSNAISASSADIAASFGAAGGIVCSPDPAFDCGNAKGMVARGVQSESIGTTFTVEAWVKLRQATGQIFEARNASKTFALTVNDGSNASTVSGTVHVSSDNSVNIITVDGLIPIADGKWHHVVVVSTNATSLTLYVDGVQDQTLVSANTLGAITASVGWGGIPNIFGAEGGTPTLNGTIDECAAWYSTALTPTQIAAHYAAGALPRLQDLTGARITTLLASVGWPTTLQLIDTGQSQLQALSNELANTVLASVQTVADTEGGQLFIDASGRVVFYSRYHTSASPNGLAAVTLGDSGTTGAGGESPYLVGTVNIQYDDLDLYNEVVVTPSNKGAQVATDATSQTTYGKRTRSLTTLDYSTTTALGHAQADLNRYKTPLQRVRAVTFTPYSDPDVLFPAALGFELLTRIAFTRRPKDGAGSTFTQQSLIEGVEHTVTPGSWQTTWALSPTDASPIYWIIDDPIAGKIVDGASQSPPVAIGY